MSYHDLSDSGMTPEAMRDEATRICDIIRPMVGDYTMRQNELKFVLDIADKRKPVNTKQLFWLRDLMGKYCQ
jgi:hypothetical protein